MVRSLVVCVSILGMFGCADIDNLVRSKPVEIRVESRSSFDEIEEDDASAVERETQTLADYLEYAALNSPELEAAFNRWKAALQVIPEVKALPDPRFSYTYYIREIETRTGPQQQKFALSQTFPWFGKLELREDIAFQASEVKRLDYERVKTELFYEIKNNYYELYYLSRAIDIARENMGLLEFLESIVRSQYTTGSASHGDIIKAQVELGRLEERVLSLEDRFEPVRAQLNASMNRPFNAPVIAPATIELMEIPRSDEELLAILVENNPSLKAKDFAANREKIDIDIAKKNFYPDVTLGLEYIDTGPARMPTSDDGRDPIMAMVSLNLPVWRDKYRAIEEREQREYLATVNDREALENTLVSRIQLVLYDFRDAKRKVDLYGNALIPKARQTLEVQEQAFSVGSSDFLDVLDSQRVLLEFQLEREKALTVQAQKLAELEMLLAQEVGKISE